jgi:hypothetical protein
MRSYFTAILLLLSIGLCFPQNCDLKKTSKLIIGRPISEFVERMQLDSIDYTVMQESPMILRGIRGSKGGLDFIIYTERQAQEIVVDTSGGKWKVLPGKTDRELIMDKKAIGFSLRCGSSIVSRGETIVYYNFDW